MKRELAGKKATITGYSRIFALTEQEASCRSPYGPIVSAAIEIFPTATVGLASARSHARSAPTAQIASSTGFARIAAAISSLVQHAPPRCLIVIQLRNSA